MSNRLADANETDEPELESSGAALAVPGQYSLRALFVATLISAVGFAILAPIVRSWPANYQLHFVRVGAACIAFPAAFYTLQVWRQRKLEHESGALLAYLPGKSAKITTGIAIAWYLMALANWILMLHLSASAEQDVPGTWNFVVLGALCNSGSLCLYAMRGIQFRDRGLIIGNVRIEWKQINRFTWSGDSKLVLYLTSRTMIAIPLPASARETIDRVVRMRTERTTNNQQKPTVEAVAPPP